MSATRRGAADPAAGRTGSDAAVRGALLIGVAIVIGLLLLWRGHDDDGSTISAEGGTPVATTAATGGTTPDGSPVTTPGETTAAPPSTHAPAQVSVLVANGTGTSGGASAVSQRLMPKGYGVLPAANAGSSDVPRTVVYYREGFDADAAQIARDLGVPEASVGGMLEPMPATPPVAEKALESAQTAQVLVVLGVDNAIQQ
jgi:hypothetical protein